MESIFGREDPFATSQPENAFYYPTTPKNIDFNEKMTSLSSNMLNRESRNGTNILESEKFLVQSNTLLCDDIPTKDSGTEMKDASGSSKFDETWPSTTEQSTSPNIDSSSQSDSRTLSQIARQSVVPAMVENPSTESNPKGTIAGYISRFRNEPPKSREERQRNSPLDKKAGDFWWLHSPDSSSTPKESDSSFTPPQRLRNSHFKKPPPSPERVIKRQNLGKTKEKELPSTYLKNIKESDSETARIQKRAERLLEISEGTLSSSSSEPVRSTQQNVYAARTTSSENKQETNLFNKLSKTFKPPEKVVHRSNLTPEDDILYQWRLARKMERAKQGGNVFSKLPHMGIDKQSFVTDARVVMADKTNKEDKSTTILGKGTPIERRDGEFHGTKAGLPPKDEATMKMNTRNITRNIDRNSKDSSAQTQSRYIYPDNGEILSVDYVDLPSHMHAVCDILPCPHVAQRQKSEEASEIIDNNIALGIRTIDYERALGKCCKQKELIDSTHVPLNAPVISLDKDTAIMNRNLTKQTKKSSSEIPNVQRYERAAKTKETEVVTSKRESEKIIQQRDDHEGVAGRQKDRMNDVFRDFKAKERRGKGGENINQNKEMKNVISEVVSDHLFSSSMASENSSTSSRHDQSMDGNLQDGDQTLQNLQECDSEGEFPEDEILKILRQKRANYLKTLRKIEGVLSEYPLEQK